MCKAPVLLQPDFNKKFYLQTDASAYGMGAILLQEREVTPFLSTHKKPILHLIAYFLATFTQLEAISRMDQAPFYNYDRSHKLTILEIS